MKNLVGIIFLVFVFSNAVYPPAPVQELAESMQQEESIHPPMPIQEADKRQLAASAG